MRPLWISWRGTQVLTMDIHVRANQLLLFPCRLLVGAHFNVLDTFRLDAVLFLRRGGLGYDIHATDGSLSTHSDDVLLGCLVRYRLLIQLYHGHAEESTQRAET